MQRLQYIVDNISCHVGTVIDLKGGDTHNYVALSLSFLAIQFMQGIVSECVNVCMYVLAYMCACMCGDSVYLYSSCFFLQRYLLKISHV